MPPQDHPMTLPPRLSVLALSALLLGCPSNPPRNDAALAADSPDAAVDSPATDAPSADLGIQFTFVSAAIQGQAAGDSGVTIRAQMSWHATIQGQSADGGITIRGVMY